MLEAQTTDNAAAGAAGATHAATPTAAASPATGEHMAGEQAAGAHASVEHASVEHASVEHGAAHPTPAALGMDATQWVALAMLAVVAIMVWKKVPAAIAGSLDKKIAAIREQLDAATKLRQEAEALKAEYQAKAAQALKDAEAIRAHAQVEAAQITEQAKVDAETMIARRTKMAEDKIAAAERTAIADVRRQAADVAAKAAAQILASRHGAADDRALIDQTIAAIDSKTLN